MTKDFNISEPGAAVARFPLCDPDATHRVPWSYSADSAGASAACAPLPDAPVAAVPPGDLEWLLSRPSRNFWRIFASMPASEASLTGPHLQASTQRFAKN